AINADIGIVMIHVTTIRLAVPHFTPLKRCDEPTPRMEDEITCVVLTGKWRKVAPNIINTTVISAATPFTGRILIILPPNVLMIFQPPTAVPKAIAVAQINCTQV